MFSSLCIRGEKCLTPPPVSKQNCSKEQQREESTSFGVNRPGFCYTLCLNLLTWNIQENHWTSRNLTSMTVMKCGITVITTERDSDSAEFLSHRKAVNKCTSALKMAIRHICLLFHLRKKTPILCIFCSL